MPTLLKHDTIRMLEASVNCLEIAIANLYHTRRISFKQPSAAFAPEIGLLGTCVELAMSACLIQTYGIQAIKLDGGMYKTGKWIIDDFLQMLKSPPKKAEFLCEGITDQKRHFEDIIATSRSLRILISCRAAGFHAGRGVSYEVTMLKANEAIDFLKMLRASTRLNPYLSYIPELIALPPDRKIIIENLYTRISAGPKDKISEDLVNIFLVLPEVSENEPEWIEQLERIRIAPKASDLEYLIKTLGVAVPVGLRKVHDGRPEESMPFRYAPDEPNAIAIQTQFFKKQFSKTYESYHAYVGIANGARARGQIQTPGADETRALFVEGIEQSGILMGKPILTAHESWPAVVASFASQGTPGPFWFIIRKVPDIDQLLAIIREVIGISKQTLQKRLEILSNMIAKYALSGSISKSDKEVDYILTDMAFAEKAKTRLISRIRQLGFDQSSLQMTAVEDSETIAVSAIYALVNGKVSFVNDAALGRLFIDAASDYEDVHLVDEIAKEIGAHVGTNVRKAYRRIDFSTFGPSLVG